MYHFTDEIRTRLFEMQDEAYRDFHAKLIPNVDKETIIGVRVPELRKYAKKIAAHSLVGEFLRELPHRYYDENNVHTFVVEQIRDYGECLREVERFLPYIDNWATCDMWAPKVFAKHKEELLPKIKEWMASGKTYTVRFGIGMLMRYYLGENFRPEYLSLVAAVKSEEYYVNMMAAWYFATALAKHFDETLPYLTESRLPAWPHNKTIQKACESCRIAPDRKDILRALKCEGSEEEGN